MGVSFWIDGLKGLLVIFVCGTKGVQHFMGNDHIIAGSLVPAGKTLHHADVAFLQAK